MFKDMWGMIITMGIIYISVACGVIYFIFWCLKEFGILAAINIG